MREKKVWLMVAGMIIITTLLVGWQRPQAKSTRWDYKILPVNSVSQGEQVLRDMDGQGWEFIAVQPMRTKAELVPRIHPVQNPIVPIRPPETEPTGQPEAMYFFRRAK